eukprot:2556980-Amphidinium_carterae.1
MQPVGVASCLQAIKVGTPPPSYKPWKSMGDNQRLSVPHRKHCGVTSCLTIETSAWGLYLLVCFSGHPLRLQQAVE